MFHVQAKRIFLLSIFTLAANLALSGTSVAAEPGLDQLKQSFSSLAQSTEKEFNKAAAMKPILLKYGNAITQSECEALTLKIRANYKVNPFAFVYEQGSTYNYICGGKYASLPNFVLNSSGVSNLGLPYAMVIQLESHDTWGYRDVQSNYFIDNVFRVVEKQNLSYTAGTKNLMSYDIAAADQAGNVYLELVEKNYNVSGGLAQDVSGNHTIDQYIPADGSAPFPLMRRRVTNASDHAKDYAIVMFQRADQKDWQDFQLLVTHAWAGGFYNYGGKYYSHVDKPENKSSLTVKYRGGKEYCAYGYTSVASKPTRFPANAKAYEDCLNY